MYKVGTRVIAIQSAGQGVVNTYGSGTYVGEKVPPKEVSALFNEKGVTNPCIKLDTGAEVYGMECWWGPEEMMKEKFSKYQEVLVPVDRGS